jgi:hypothetical protein
MRFNIFDLTIDEDVDIRRQLEAVIDLIDMKGQIQKLFQQINDTPYLPGYGTNLFNVLGVKNNEI